MSEDLPLILNRAQPRPPQRTPGPFRLIANNFAAMAARVGGIDTRLARLEAHVNELREAVDVKRNSFVYAAGIHAVFNGTINIETDAFRVMLLADTYLPDAEHHSTRADVLSHAVAEVGSQSVAVSKATRLGKLVVTLGGARWQSADVRARYGVYYYHDSGGGAAQDTLIFLADFGKIVVARGGPFDLAESIFTL